VGNLLYSVVVRWWCTHTGLLVPLALEMRQRVSYVHVGICVLLHAALAFAMNARSGAGTMASLDVAMLIQTGELTADGPWSTERDCPRFCDNACQCLVKTVRTTCQSKC